MFQANYVCRVCMAEGAWNIFSNNAIDDKMCTVASINCIREKLQYVTELQLHEDDGLPIRICELCIVQLNLAYRFKLLATESDGRLRASLRTSETSMAQNALTNVGDAPEAQAEPEVVWVKIEEHSDEISIGSTMISEERINADGPSNVAANPNYPLNGMVCLQKDIVNPAEDAAYLKQIKQKEVISKSWQKDDETNPAEQKPHPTSPKKSKTKRKLSKTRTKRMRSENYPQPHRSDANDTPKRAKLTGKEANRPTASDQTPNSSGTCESTMETKQTEAILRKKRMEKLFKKLRIDMMYDTPAGRHSLTEQQPKPNIEIHGPKIGMKRRNSICVSSYAQWL
uniref:ZAD domain-containing protein n=1 Tax=Anopheles culicifacies TaxID=139723 RepID=A0A182LXX8_9DIPT